MGVMRSTRDLGTRTLTDRISEYNKKVNELAEIFTNNSKTFLEKGESDKERLKYIQENYEKLLEKVKEIENFEADSFANQVESDVSFKKDIDEITIDETELSNVINQYKSSNDSTSMDLPKNALRFDLYNSIKTEYRNGGAKVFVSNPIESNYEINDKTILLDRSKINDISCINFGISYSQLNMSHFYDQNPNNIEYSGDPNIINRYYRGTIIIYNNENVPKIKAFITIPDNEVLNNNQTIGPEFDFDFYYDKDFIYIRCYNMKPFRLNWIDDLNGIRIFDMFDRERSNENTNVMIRANMFLYTIENSADTTLTLTTDDLSKKEEINEISNSKFSIKPINEGFYKYINFNSDNSDNIIGIEAQKYSFFSHTNKYHTDVDAEILINSITNENYYEFLNFISEESGMLLSEFFVGSGLKIESLFMRKNGDIYIACEYGIFKKDQSLNQYFRLFNKPARFVSTDNSDNLITFVDNEGFYEAEGDVFKTTPTWFKHTANFKEFLRDSENTIKNIFFYNNTIVVMSEKTIWISSKEGSYNRKLRDIRTDETFKNSNISYYNNEFVINTDQTSTRYGVGRDRGDEKYEILLDIGIENISEGFDVAINNNSDYRLEIRDNSIIYGDKSKTFISYKEDELMSGEALNNVLFNPDDSSRFVAIIGNKLITCLYDPKVRKNTIDNIKSSIRNLLTEEKNNRFNNNPDIEPLVPYKVEIHAKKDDPTIKDNEFNALYKEVGVYIGNPLLDPSTVVTMEDLQTGEDFDYYLTGIGTLLINKRDRTFGYWATNGKSPKILGDPDRIENVRFEYVKIPCGLKKLYYPQNFIPNTFIIFYGVDEKLYVMGYNTERKIDESESPDTFYLTPKRITEEKALALKNYIDEKYPIVLWPYLEDGKVKTKTLKKELVGNDEIDKDDINNYDVTVYNLIEPNTNKIYDVWMLIWIANSTWVVIDKEKNYWIRGHIDGLPCITYSKDFIKLNKDLYIRNIKNIVTNDFRTNILTDYAIYESNDLVIDDNNEYREDDNEINDFFKEENVKLQDNTLLDINQVKEMKLTDYNTFLLMNNGNLYVRGLSANGIESTRDYFTLIKTGVKNIWTGRNSVFLAMNDNSSVVLGSNQNYQLGVKDETIESSGKTLSFYTPSDNLYIKSIWTFKNNLTFAIMSDNSLYATGNNTNMQLGLNKTAEIIKEFTKVNFDKGLEIDRIYNYNNKTYIITKVENDSDVRLFYTNGKGKFVEDTTLKAYKKESDHLVNNIFFSYDNYSLIIEYKNYDTYYLYSVSTEKYFDTNTKTVKALPVMNEGFEVVLNENGNLYKYKTASNEMIKINEKVNNFFINNSEKVIKLIKNDFSFAGIIINSEYESIKSNIDLQKEYIENTKYFAKNDGEDIFYYLTHQGTEFTLNGRFNEISFYYKSSDLINAYLLINDNLRIEIPSNLDETYKLFKYHNDDIYKVKFVFNIADPEYNESKSYKDDFRIRDAVIKNTYISNYGLGTSTTDTKSLKDVRYDEKVNYIESFYGYKHVKSDKEVSASYFTYELNKNNGFNTIKDLAKKKSEVFNIVRKGKSEILIPIASEDLDKDKIYSVDFEILPILPNVISDVVNVRSINDTESKKIESIIK